MTQLLSVLVFALVLSSAVSAKEFQNHTNMMDHGDGHLMDMDGGMVMGQNTDKLPGGCDSIAEVKEITVHAGHKYAEKFPGTMFAFDTQEYQFEPCTKLTVHFINDDEVRHQWMMHGLPKYLYPKGMFHLEVSGPGEVTGTLILPSDDKTYLVHCDIAQHMEKGMKGQLKVGKGSGDLPSIPGLTPYAVEDDYSGVESEVPEATLAVADESLGAAGAASPVNGNTEKTSVAKTEKSSATSAQPASDEGLFSGLTVVGLAIGLIVAPLLAHKLKGKTVAEAVTYLFELLSDALVLLFKPLNWLIRFVLNKTKALPKQ
jgi:hypothetical protein